MSLTSAFCPAADMIVNDVKGAALTVDNVVDCQVEVTFTFSGSPKINRRRSCLLKLYVFGLYGLMKTCIINIKDEVNIKIRRT